MSSNINSARRWVKTAIAFMFLTIANEDTMKTLWIKLVVTIRAKKRIAAAPKNAQKRVDRSFVYKYFIRAFVLRKNG